MPKTAANCKELCQASIAKAQTDYGCSVCNIVTDNAKSMEKMREALQKDDPQLNGSLIWQPLTFFYTTGSITLRLYKIMSKKWTETWWNEKGSWTTIYFAKPETSEVSLHLLQQQSTSIKGPCSGLSHLAVSSEGWGPVGPHIHCPEEIYTSHTAMPCLMINSDRMPTSGWQRRMLSMSLLPFNLIPNRPLILQRSSQLQAQFPSCGGEAFTGSNYLRDSSRLWQTFNQQRPHKHQSNECFQALV